MKVPETLHLIGKLVLVSTLDKANFTGVLEFVAEDLIVLSDVIVGKGREPIELMWIKHWIRLTQL